jgi:glycosyltransferase involved in cell wall biosynthesis
MTLGILKKMDITVILCTYNRCDSLRKTLSSIAASGVPDSVTWEILVVDNNSKDRTRETVEDFRRAYSNRFRYLFEPRQGKSYALNAGISKALGDILVFTDDDVTFEPTWLRNLTAPLRDGQWVGAGGRTLPERSFSAPRWLKLDGIYALGPLALFDRGLEACDLAEPPFGNNMAFRKEMLAKYGGFRTDLGPRPGTEIRSEDTEFGKRVLSAGERVRYEPSAIAYHAIPDSRVQKQYFLAWWFDKARAEIRELGTPSDKEWCVNGIPFYLFRRLAVWTLRWILALEPSQRFSSKVNTWQVAAGIIENYHRSRTAKSQADA